MTIRLKISPPIPDGLAIYTWVRVAGTQYRKEAALRFAKNRDQTLQLEREPGNKDDTNAIKVIGQSKGLVFGGSDPIGYVPRETAACIVEGGYWGIVEPSLGKIYVSDDDYDEDPYIQIDFRILGPDAQKQAFRQFHYAVEQRKFEDRPATALQKEFYRTFDFKVPKGLIYLDAKKFINEKSAGLREHDESALDGWENYSAIIEELSDRDARELYDIKAVSISRLRLAVVELVNEGRTLEEMADDIEIVTERLINLHPELEVD